MGMNVLDGREAINDNEFAWCENAIPIASAALYPVGVAVARGAVLAESTAPSYTMTFTQSGVNYQFVVFSASGNGYIIRLGAGFSNTLIITGLTSTQTYATPYNNQGILIIDPAGYWDWNVTAPNTLTAQNNALANSTLIFSNQIAGGTQLKNGGVNPGGPGAGATVQTSWGVVKVVINAAGTGYQVGDALTLTDGSPTTPAQIIVSAIGGGGAITGITLPAGGSYPGPPTLTLVAVGPTGTVVSGGSGTGATFTVTISTLGITIITRGTGYTGAPFYNDLIATNVAQNRFNFTSSGVIGGIGIATYAGRVWIALGRTVYFTDINSYNSFGGVGGSFFISDSYLHANITVLYAANNYLYIFGDTSIDALSNVTVSLGVTSFSRINITASVGTNSPASVFAYYRAIVFFNVSGIYLLAGATPEKISEKISKLIENAVPGVSTISQVYGAQALVRGELCAAMQFVVSDIFTQGGANRVLMVLFFRGKWWVYSFLPLDTGGFFTAAMASIPNQGVLILFSFRVTLAGVQLYQLIPGNVPASGLAAWLLKTKLWDAGAPLLEKQSLNAAIAGQWAAAGATGVTINIDSELSTAPAVQSPLAGNPANYALVVSAANMGGGQYLGLTVAGSTDMTQIDMLALRAKAEHDKLA